MAHLLTLEIPENIYQPLAEEAKRKGARLKKSRLRDWRKMNRRVMRNLNGLPMNSLIISRKVSA